MRSESRRRGWWMNVRMTGGSQIYKERTGLALRMQRKYDLGVRMMSQWLGHSKGARGFI